MRVWALSILYERELDIQSSAVQWSLRVLSHFYVDSWHVLPRWEFFWKQWKLILRSFGTPYHFRFTIFSLFYSSTSFCIFFLSVFILFLFLSHFFVIFTLMCFPVCQITAFFSILCSWTGWIWWILVSSWDFGRHQICRRRWRRRRRRRGSRTRSQKREPQVRIVGV